MLLSFDVVPDAIEEHDDWHTHEHLPERLSIPGFLRGSRWTALSGQPRYFVMYEVEELGTLASTAYLERLNNPTPWTAKMMTHYRGMTRGLCSVTGGFGLGLGSAGLLVRFKPAPERETTLREWLIEKQLPGLPSQAGLASAHLFEAALAPPSTNEQRIRGKDSAMHWTLLVTGYSTGKVASLAEKEFSAEALEKHGATKHAAGIHRLEYSLTAREVLPPGI
ncbi:MAG TPA: hypothetical protein VKS43_10660 [Burkholderiales bacterium]|nr:hypothetical protein [Burkholderiales bacterium]